MFHILENQGFTLSLQEVHIDIIKMLTWCCWIFLVKLINVALSQIQFLCLLANISSKTSMFCSCGWRIVVLLAKKAKRFKWDSRKDVLCCFGRMQEKPRAACHTLCNWIWKQRPWCQAKNHQRAASVSVVIHSLRLMVRAEEESDEQNSKFNTGNLNCFCVVGFFSPKENGLK